MFVFKHYVHIPCDTAIHAKKGCDHFVDVNCIPATSLLQLSKTAPLVTELLRFLNSRTQLALQSEVGKKWIALDLSNLCFICFFFDIPTHTVSLSKEVCLLRVCIFFTRSNIGICVCIFVVFSYGNGCMIPRMDVYLYLSKYTCVYRKVCAKRFCSIEFVRTLLYMKNYYKMIVDIHKLNYDSKSILSYKFLFL